MSDAINATLLAESRPALVEQLRDEIACDGPITFARFMELALTHPAYGYYTAADANARPGFGGDFLTAPETDPIFGHALARQLAECFDRLGRPQTFTVREAGGGGGTLARQLIEGLRAERPDVLDAARYELSDVNARHVTGALADLREFAPEVAFASATHGPITGVVLANELLDAFPVHRLRVVDGALRELYVGWRNGWFADELGELSDARLAEPLAGLLLLEEQTLEVSSTAWEWARALGGQLARGYAILIDYGYPAVELYGPTRAEGTLKSYSAHLAGVEPYRRVGRQDLTAHVDFSAVSRAAQSGGLDELGLTTQAHFFAGLGIEELLMRVQETAADPYRYVNAREAVLHLLDPRGLGRFRVLILGKGVEREPLLRGLAFKL